MLPEDLIALTNLKRLRLNNNLIFDTIPNYWDSLDQLFLLDLRFNSLIGSIPTSYTTMAKINTIHLDNNSLDSLIPSGLGYNASLRTFTASNNMLAPYSIAVGMSREAGIANPKRKKAAYSQISLMDIFLATSTVTRNGK